MQHNILDDSLISYKQGQTKMSGCDEDFILKQEEYLETLFQSCSSEN